MSIYIFAIFVIIAILLPLLPSPDGTNRMDPIQAMFPLAVSPFIFCLAAYISGNYGLHVFSTIIGAAAVFGLFAIVMVEVAIIQWWRSR